MEAKKQAFIAKLHELFQINNGLDFGIYRIINEKKSDIETYRARLENQFYQMEMAIAQMQQNYSSFLS